MSSSGHGDFDGLAFGDIVAEDVPAVLPDCYGKPFPGTLYRDVVRTVGAGVYVAQGKVIPTVRKLRTEGECPETCRTEAEDAFGEYPAIEGVFGGKMPLVSLGPCLYRIRDMVAEQAVT